MSADILAGELVHINSNGQGTNVIGSASLALPAKKDVKKDSLQDIEVALSGVAVVKVSDYSNIVVGSPLTIGDDGKGVKVAGSGEFQIGLAMQKPESTTEFISVLINPVAKAGNLY